MGETTEIAWTDATFNPWWGCQRVSPGCEHCYAETFSKRVGLKVWGPQAERRFFGAKHWNEPVKWNAKAAKDGVRKRVFCASMADVFEDREDLVEQRNHLWEVILATPSLDWLLLTKRPENMIRMLPWGPSGLGPTPWKNVWLGTTVEDQKRGARADILREVPGHIRFLSMEPLLEDPGTLDLAGIDWVIVGGESGGGARPFNPSWAKDIVAQCRSAGVACFVKQLGANVLDFSGRLKDRKGGDWSEWPEDLRVREFPDGRR